MAGGRKLEFNKQQALEAAMRVFWEKGYLGASMADLTAAMGINKPSLYAAFGNKEALFRQAAAHYNANYNGPHIEHLNQSGRSLEERLNGYLRSVLAAQCAPDQPKGCFIAACLGEAASDCMPQEARRTIMDASASAFDVLTRFFETDRDARRVGLDRDAEQHATYLVALLHGLASLARSGKPFASLAPVVDAGLVGLGLRPAGTSGTV